MPTNNKLIDPIKLFIMINLINMVLLYGCSNNNKIKQDIPINPADTPPPSTINPPTPIYGVTIDSTDQLDDIITSLDTLALRATARIVFDEQVPAKSYLNAVKQIHTVSDIMGEIVDSSTVAQYTVETYQQRTIEYYELLADHVDIWEIGNEVNGEWLGDPATVAKKIIPAFRYIHDKGGVTALTLYYNEDCWTYPWEEMYTWIINHIPIDMKLGLDYVLISYYEEDCENLRPDWPTAFHRLSTLFPNANIGFGEVGTSQPEKKVEYLKRYYTLTINEPKYIGGYFWWYYKQDMVPKSNALWQVLNDIFLVTVKKSDPLTINNP